MSNRAVFLDRDNTIIEDPGYISDPSLVKLLPGAELAVKSLVTAGYKIVVVTNQSGVARGLLTEETLRKIHDELRRQLQDKGTRVDAIYYCPFHPEGTVEPYAVDSDLRKPKPGMLLKAAVELNLDLRRSWMVGDGARDIEAGMRAGCRTIRIRSSKAPGGDDKSSDDDVQADFTVRNVVEAARVILREAPTGTSEPAVATPSAPIEPPSAGAPTATSTQAAPSSPADAFSVNIESLSTRQILQELLRYVRHLARGEAEDFSLFKLLGGVFQILAALCLLMTIVKMVTAGGPATPVQFAMLWALITIALQLMALTFFIIHRFK